MARAFRLSEQEAVRLGLVGRAASKTKPEAPALAPSGPAALSGAPAPSVAPGPKNPPADAPSPRVPSPAERLGIEAPSPVRKPTKKTRRVSARDATLLSMTVDRAGVGEVSLGLFGELLELRLALNLPAAPKERARTVRRTAAGKSVSYTPARTRRFSALVRGVAERALSGASAIDAPVGMEIAFVFAPPVSWPIWRREGALEGLVLPTARPDMDNLEKALLDALNGLAFVDDALVAERRAAKRFGPQDRIEVRVYRLGAVTSAAPRADLDALRLLRGALPKPA